ncbi:MAG: 6-carboxytetrahydropterin synthase [bacterium]|jgi:6-pyruvoyltetrahydropterin/6-carboxytetrahydropterin synthase|nr:6-carboxytetrahydropterin synthase [bacterium]
MIILHKVFHFCAAHRYWNPVLSEEENVAAFGEDVRLHGHNYRLIVSLTGELDERTGFVADLGRIKTVVRERVIRVLDHARIDTDIDWFSTRQPSTENLLRWIRLQLVDEELGCRVVRLRLHETESIYTDLVAD